MDLTLRRTFTFIEEKLVEAGRVSDRPLRKVAVAHVFKNPLAGKPYVEDLTGLITASEALGRAMAAQAVAAMGDMPVESYGKGGLVGVAGEQEHANALLTTIFANPFRDAIGGAGAWISSMTKVAAPGASIDIPMNAKNNVYVRSHYDGMSLTIPDGPQADEVVLIFCLASRGRLNARVGGMTFAEATAQ
jgi:hypothetical protein